MSLERQVQKIQERGPRFKNNEEKIKFGKRLQNVKKMREDGLIKKNKYNLAMAGTICNTLSAF